MTSLLLEDKYFGFIYETTNLVNSKKYIGKCIFKRQNDWKTYLGSGTYLKRAIKKYGVKKFKREILFLALDEEELNQLEEEVIEICNAVQSKAYYNLKKTSIGGDIFTDHPEKERIRKLRVKQMSGKGNHQYGKPKTEKMIKRVKESNSKKIIVDGKTYNSITKFSKISGIGASTICFRLKSPYFNYRYANEKDNKVQKQEKKIHNKSIPVYINDIKYNSFKEASEKLGIPSWTISRRTNNDKYPNFHR